MAGAPEWIAHPTAAVSSPVTDVPEDLGTFLAVQNAKVVDIVPGVVPTTRRLLVGDRHSGELRYVVAVAVDARHNSPVEAEHRLVDELASRLLPTLAAVVPRAVGPLSLGDCRAVAFSAVPGLATRTAAAAPPRQLLEPVRSWLHMLWQDTGSTPAPSDIGRWAADELLARYAGSPQLAPTLTTVLRARQQLNHVSTRRTVVHGCLCPGHVYVDAGRVVGVDDWALGSMCGDPLRDLGGFVVRCAGTRLRGLLAERTRSSRPLRDFVRCGLAALGLPIELWRDVVVLAALEQALAALRRHDTTGLRLLAAAVDASSTTADPDRSRT